MSGIKTILLLTVTFLLVTPLTSFNHAGQDEKTRCTWGYRNHRHYETDTSYFCGSFFDEGEGCFPGLDKYVDRFDSARTMIYNRWGEIQFDSRDISEQWICNDSSESDIKEGTYFYLMMYKDKNRALPDTVTGSFSVFHNL